MNYFFTNSFPNAGSGNKLFVYFLGNILSMQGMHWEITFKCTSLN